MTIGPRMTQWAVTKSRNLAASMEQIQASNSRIIPAERTYWQGSMCVTSRPLFVVCVPEPHSFDAQQKCSRDVFREYDGTQPVLG